VSAVPRHSEEELRQQWAFLDALVDRQAASLKSGVQDPEEDDVVVPMVAADSTHVEEITTLTQRITTLEDERTTLLRRIDLSEEARIAAESARAAAEVARFAAERALAQERSRLPAWPPVAASTAATPGPPVTTVAPGAPVERAKPGPPSHPATSHGPPVQPAAAQPAESGAANQGDAGLPKVKPPKARRKTWWQRIRE
jgi:hypothetical protein